MSAETFSERQIIAKFAAGERLGRHFFVNCESPMSAHVMAATLASPPQDYTVISDTKTSLRIECLGRTVSSPHNYRTMADDGHPVSNS